MYIYICIHIHDTYGGFHRWATPKWMVYNIIMGNPIEMDDLGVPIVQATSI